MKEKKISKTKIDKAIKRRTNQKLRLLIIKLKKQKNPFWVNVAYILSRPLSRSIKVNLSDINGVSKENRIMLVPGKVLGNGNVNHKIKLACFSISKSARKKLEENGSSIVSIEDLLNEDIKNIELIKAKQI